MGTAAKGKAPIQPRSILVAIGALLLAGSVALGLHSCAAINGAAPAATATVQGQSGLSGQFMYAAQNDGTIHVYDISQSHRLVKVIRVFSCCADVRGAAAAAPTHRFYVMYNRASHGHVAAVDLLSDRVLWDRVAHVPGVDRGDVTPDGKTLYLPTWESDPNSQYELVLDATTGAEVGRIALPARSHDTIVSLDGRRVFMETKSATAALYVADTATNRVVETVGGYCCTRVLGPFAVNGTNTLLVNDVIGYAGFQIGDIASGRVIASIPFDGGGTGGHGIAWTPDEREVWVNDGVGPYVHVFTVSGTQARESHLVRVSHTPHWLTFSIDGRFAYVAGRKGAGDPTDIIDTATYQRIGTLGPSEDLLEVDASGGIITRVGKQFGVGRVTSPGGMTG
jgi:DNA-binding beta-propeller fold protein YncE